MKKLILILCLTFVFVSCGQKNEDFQTNGKPTIKIGAALPLSGEYARIGQANQKAISMALEKWKNKSTKYNYEVVFEDDQMASIKAATVAHKFINVDHVKGIISTWGIVGPVYADIADKNKIISMTCADMSEITKPYYSFNHFTQDDKLSEKLVYILKKKHIKTVVFAYTVSPVCDEKAENMQKKLKATGIKVLAVERYSISEADFRSSIQKLEELNPGAYITFVLMPGTVNFVSQFEQVTQGKRELIGFMFLMKCRKNIGLWLMGDTPFVVRTEHRHSAKCSKKKQG